MKKILILLVLLSSISCIPLKNAPHIEGYKIVVAKKFKNDLPKQYAFVFKDQKSANAFYQFVYWKYGRIDISLTENLPFAVGDKTYYLTFYERPRETVTLNLLPIVLDAVLISQGELAIMEGDGVYASDGESWYILLTVVDSELQDCLQPSYANQEKVIHALKEIKEEYENSKYLEGDTLSQ